MSLLDQAVLELLEVLDDPVMDDRDAAGAVEVGMSVLVGRRPVGGPARVSHAGLTRDLRVVGQSRFQL